MVLKQPCYELIFRPDPSHMVEPIARLKQLLKIAGRGMGLKCISAREVDSTLPDSMETLIPVALDAIAARGAGQ